MAGLSGRRVRRTRADPWRTACQAARFGGAHPAKDLRNAGQTAPPQSLHATTPRTGVGADDSRRAVPSAIFSAAYISTAVHALLNAWGRRAGADLPTTASTLDSLASVSSMRPTASSTSASLVPKPRLKRIEDSASSPSRPMALNTCDGSGVPEVQAEPVEAARRG